jgi:hypothetical protein
MVFEMCLTAGIALSNLTTLAQTRPQLSVATLSQGLQLSVTGDPATSYRLEASTDLAGWAPMAITFPSVGTFPANTRFELSDREFAFGGQKFYRAARADFSGPGATNTTPEILVSDPLLEMYEGGTVNFTVQLAKTPAGAVVIQVQRTGGSTNIALTAGTTLIFDVTNWNSPQVVTVSAGQNSDFQDSLAELSVTASNLVPSKIKVLAVDSTVDDEFVGPFDSWKDLKRDFGAIGDGITDDTLALQNALNTLQPNSTNHVLYLPAGTYRITQPLDFRRLSPSQAQTIMFIGEGPATTTIRWAGPTNGVMLTYGAWYSKMSRLTFDGAGIARTAIAHDLPFSTHNEFSDMVFQNLSFGIEAGTSSSGGNAETAVERCHFIHCTQAGISLQNANSLDWFIWNSEFDDCGLGISNIYGAGNFQVYESLFRRSLLADMSIGNTGYFSARNNTSIGSAAFFTSTAVAACGLITLQGNTVVSPKGVPLQLGDYGPVVLLDNWIEAYQGLAANIEPSAGFFSLGNTFTVSNAIPRGFDGPTGIRLDDVVTQQKIPLALPKLPAALPRMNRTIFELPGPTNAAGIQAAINQAATSGSARPIVHLPAGEYFVSNTISIPAASDLQLVGDGGSTIIHWTGNGPGPVLTLAGPARATLRDFNILGPATNSSIDGIVIDKADQMGGRIYFDQLDVKGCSQVGLFVDSLTNTSVTLANFYHEGNPVSVRVAGGSAIPDYNSAAGQVSVFGGASAANGLSYDMSKGGKLLVRDVWYEASTAGTSPRFMVCTNSGWFTLSGAQVALLQSKTNTPVIEISNFVGRLSFLASQFTFSNNAVSVKGQQTNTAVMLLGSLLNTTPQFNAPGAQTSMVQSFQTQDNLTFNPLTDTGSTNPDFLKRMLAQIRSTRPPSLSPIRSGVTDVRIRRVIVESARTGVHLTQ